MLNVGGWSSLPGAEAQGALGTFLSGLLDTLYLHPAIPPPKRLWFFCHIIPSPSSAPTILSLRLQFFHPHPLYVAACPDLIPMISRAGLSHHHLYRRIPGFLSDTKQKSIIGLLQSHHCQRRPNGWVHQHPAGSTSWNQTGEPLLPTPHRTSLPTML